jgi:hypothetical protein
MNPGEYCVVYCGKRLVAEGVIISRMTWFDAKRQGNQLRIRPKRRTKRRRRK